MNDRERDIAEDGTDLTLIRWMLSLTPTERVQHLEDTVAGLLALRGAAADESDDDGGHMP